MRISHAILGVLTAASLLVGPAAQAAAPPPAPAGAPPQPGPGGPPRQAPDPYAGKKKLLVLADVQTGFHHDSINHAMAVIERLGRESGAYVAFLRTDSQMVTKTPIVGSAAATAAGRSTPGTSIISTPCSSSGAAKGH